MPTPSVARPTGLTDRQLRAICERVVGRAATSTLLPVARAIAAEVEADFGGGPTVREEVEALARFIARARREIRAIGADDIADAYIPRASDELGAIASHLEEATGAILDCCERIQTILSTAAASGDNPAGDVEVEVIRIFEACNFQDLTGQRIAKIVETLSEIERRTHGLVGILRGSNAAPPRRRSRAAPPVATDEGLLNGPALPGQGVSQSDVDAMLATGGSSTR